MSKVHVLTASGREYRLVLHTAMPGGNNSAGKTWKDAYFQDRKNRETNVVDSVLSTGIGAGNISAVELAQVNSADVIEIQATLLLESGGTSAAQVDVIVDKVISDELAKLQQVYKYFGYTQG
jgi:hypothetical protein